MLAWKVKFKKYFSGKLAIIQIAAGVGAFAGRSAATYLVLDQAVWTIVAASQLGSFAGYLGSYVVGYWIAFKADYTRTDRSMGWDICKLELVEQFPSLVGVIPAALAQAALIEAGVHPIVSVNAGSWLGPHKIVNWIAMLSSNSLKKAWVDGTWSPSAFLRRITRKR